MNVRERMPPRERERPYSIPLFSGIGNVIQSLPFAFVMKRRYGEVTAFHHSLSFPETRLLVRDVFDRIYSRRSRVPSDHRFAVVPRRRSFPEFKSWFADNREVMPKRFGIDYIGYQEVSMKHKVVIWPECRSNWICKRWLRWPELISELEDVAVVGLGKGIEGEEEFKGVTDYRGKLTLMEVGGLIRNANIYIGNEGGISHYSAALGTRTYIIFGCTDPVKCMPPKNAVPISKELPCQPCQFTRMLRKRGGRTLWGCEKRRCLDRLRASDVMKVIHGEGRL